MEESNKSKLEKHESPGGQSETDGSREQSDEARLLERLLGGYFDGVIFGSLRQPPPDSPPSRIVRGNASLSEDEPEFLNRFSLALEKKDTLVSTILEEDIFSRRAFIALDLLASFGTVVFKPILYKVMELELVQSAQEDEDRQLWCDPTYYSLVGIYRISELSGLSEPKHLFQLMKSVALNSKLSYASRAFAFVKAFLTYESARADIGDLALDLRRDDELREKIIQVAAGEPAMVPIIHSLTDDMDTYDIYNALFDTTLNDSDYLNLSKDSYDKSRGDRPHQ